MSIYRTLLKVPLLEDKQIDSFYNYKNYQKIGVDRWWNMKPWSTNGKVELDT